MRSRSPPLPADYVPPPRERYRRGKGRRYVPDVVARVRVLIERTTWPETAIAAQVGIGIGTVHRWKVTRGWRRPDGVPLATRKVGVARAGFTRRCREALLRVERLATVEAERLEGAAPPNEGAERARALAAAARDALRPARRRAVEASS